MTELVPLLAFISIAFAIGSNNTSNAFGISIGSGIFKLKKAVFFFGFVVLLGVHIHGHKVINTVGKDILDVNLFILIISFLVSASIIIFSNWRRMPLSIHQILVGSLAGTGIGSGLHVNYLKLGEIILSWAVSPLVALFLAFLSYNLMEKTLSRLPLLKIERKLRVLLITSSFLIAYSTGANELATVLGPLLYAGIIEKNIAILAGSFSIFLGAFFLSHRVIETIGKGIVTLDPYSGFAAQFGAGCTVLIFTFFGMPISTTYCIIAAISGVGLVKGMGTVNIAFLKKTLKNWFLAPSLAFVSGYLFALISEKLIFF